MSLLHRFFDWLFPHLCPPVCGLLDLFLLEAIIIIGVYVAFEDQVHRTLQVFRETLAELRRKP